EPADEDEEDAAAVCEEHLTNWLRQIGAAVTANGFADADLSMHNLRFDVEIQVGGVSVQMAWDGAGHIYCVLAAVPEPGADLRQAQRAHNDQVLKWIESLGNTPGHHELEESEAYPGIDSEPDDEPWLS